MKEDQRNAGRRRKKSLGAKLALLTCLFLAVVAGATPTSPSIAAELQLASPDPAAPEPTSLGESRKHRGAGDGELGSDININVNGNLLVSVNESSGTSSTVGDYPDEPTTATSSLTTLTTATDDTPASTTNTESTLATDTDVSTVITTTDTVESTDEEATTTTDATTRMQDITTLSVPPPPEDLQTNSESATSTTSTVVTTATEITAASSTETSTATTTTTIATETSLRTLPSTTTMANVPLTTATSEGTRVPSETEAYVTRSTSSTDDHQTGKDVTLLVKIVFKGNWSSVCRELRSIRESLVKLVNNNVKDKISLDQVVFHENHCPRNFSTKSAEEGTSASLLVYVIDASGNLNENLTKALPSFYNKGDVTFPLPIESFALDGTKDTKGGGTNIAVIIIGSCAGFVCLLLLAALIFVMRKRQVHFNYGERCRPVSLDAYNLDNVSAYSSVTRGKSALRFSNRSYGNPNFEDSSAVPSHTLNFAGLASFCNDPSGIAREFSGIPQVSSSIDELPAGAEVKNRYANVIPLPETRVPLQRLNNDPLTEYINASYVQGPKNASKYYIASQAPTEGTVSDFWRMIWEQQVKVVLMLTDLEENGVEKCVEYVPTHEVSDCHRLFGDYQVTLKKREPKDKYAVSSLRLKNLENNTFRDVYHLWYLWPANGVPSDASGLLDVLMQARALQRGVTSPILVHCSPGTGRTGTLIALDLVIRQYEITRTVDVPRVVYTIRRNRAGAVQTKEQYTLIYQAINLYASKLAGGAVDSN
ncbi:uncharacterized protein LOC106645236 isoform X2 [Copidosoma floridanum]|uniref:uncharacterized protein LOC106645236 isoform X2 n=1 Tax=Copidosoma floridanum TaxID=29053 RepID=UPI000C6FA145|nr:uncharacterized protein LOC106645236 isoform X2 [Copidosoma floridanum]